MLQHTARSQPPFAAPAAISPAEHGAPRHPYYYVAQDYDNALELIGAAAVEQCSSGACIEGVAAVEH
eukprot:7977019-Heterocapsa_arctica.AAC.1